MGRGGLASKPDSGPNRAKIPASFASFGNIMATTPPRLQGRITRVSIEGFRSLQKVDNLALPQLTVLIGSNGAGKSNFIRFFDMLGWMLKAENLQEFIIRNGGAADQLFMGNSKPTQKSSPIW